MNHTDLLKALIKIKSYSGEEEEIRTYISKWFATKGIKIIAQDGNLIVHIQGLDNKKAFIFNSHMDTVSSGNTLWKYGAWNPTETENKIVGLGASDTKSGISASMLLAKKLHQNNKPPVDVWFTYVTSEETDGEGTRSFAKWFKKENLNKYKDIAGIFTEPTSLKEIEYGHRGNLFIKAEARGDTGHGSQPELIKNHAVHEMFKFSNALARKFKLWGKEFPSSVFKTPSVGVLTSIQAGVADSPNKFPATCTATFDIRTTPEFHKVAFERIANLGKKMNVSITNAFLPSPAGFTDPQEKIVKVTQKVIPNSKLEVAQGSADLGFLTIHGVKAIILGPGEKNQMHQVDEYCYPEQIPQAVEIYHQIIEEWARSHRKIN